MEAAMALAIGSVLGLSILIVFPLLMRLSPGASLNGLEPARLSGDWDILAPLIVTAGIFLAFFILERIIHEWHTNKHVRRLNVMVFQDLDDWSEQEVEYHGLTSHMEASELPLVATNHDGKSTDSTTGTSVTTTQDGSHTTAEEDTTSNHDNDDRNNAQSVQAAKKDVTLVPEDIKAMAYMTMVSEAFHNTADGLAIGAAFAVNPSVGWATSFAVFLHELPLELSDFAIFVHAGYSRVHAILLNVALSSFGFLGLIIGLAVGSSVVNGTRWVLAIAFGGFLYVPLANLAPEIVKVHGWKSTLMQTLFMLLGFGIMFLLAFFEPFSAC